MTVRKRPRAVLVDLDGVLRLWPPNDHALEASHGLPPGALRAPAFAPERLEPAIRGHCTDAAWRQRLRVFRTCPKGASNHCRSRRKAQP